MNFYKHYMGDYARDTAHLTMTEHGAYRLLLDHYYSTQRALPTDLITLYRICKASTKAEREAVQRIYDQFFPEGPDGRRNRRADTEIGKHEAQAIINREVGKRGGRPRKTESVVHQNRIVTETVSPQEPKGLSDNNRNGSETEPNRNRIGPEKKPNRNPSHSQSTSPLPPIEGEKPNRLRKTTTPESFDVTEPMWTWAEALGVPGDDIPSETERFLDHHRAKGSSFSSWEAAWRTWMRNSVKFRKTAAA